MENKIIQIWEDSTHETALYPTSVAEAIKWDSNTSLPQYLANNTGFCGIDASRLIATARSTTSYTATEDSYFIYDTDAGEIRLNGISMCNSQKFNSHYYGCFPLVKNDVVSFYGSATGWSVLYSVYGVKKGA